MLVYFTLELLAELELFQQISINRLLEPLYGKAVVNVCVFHPLVAVTFPENTVVMVVLIKLEEVKLEEVVCPILIVNPVIVFAFAVATLNASDLIKLVADVYPPATSCAFVMMNCALSSMLDVP